MKKLLFFLVSLLFIGETFSQALGPGFWSVELARRNQLLGLDSTSQSFLLRPLFNHIPDTIQNEIYFPRLIDEIQVNLAPIFLNTRLANKRPVGYGDFGMIPTPGFQVMGSFGVSVRYKFLSIDFQPEFISATNNPFESISTEYGNTFNLNRFYFLNNADYPERFGEGTYSKLGWGQSSAMIGFGSFETGISNKNIWWGPGQFNSLIFSTNAPGFLHLTLKTRKPAKTIIGNFEGQILSGRLENSGFDAIQDKTVNDQFFRPFTGDWRYLNAMSLTYSPKWVKGLSLGFSRTFQVYRENMGNSFGDYFPIFEAFEKESFFEDGNTVVFDGNGRDQQVSIFGRIALPKLQTELYFEFGKRDHNFNWREFILNPEHARAYLIGFNKIFDFGFDSYKIQVRGEVLRQQESVNRILRYSPQGGLTWHTHTRARGFAHYGHPLGVGLGLGNNSQIMEVAAVDGWNKIGILFERMENHQDLFYRSFGQQSERKPWVDLSLGLLYDKQFNNLLLSSKLQFIHARNYQWQLDPASTPEFPKGQNLTSMMAQVSAIYFWNKK